VTAPVVGTPASFGFADGSTGHICDLGSAPTAGQWDVLAVNSAGTVSTPDGFTPRRSVVSNAGAYLFTRQAAGGEGSTVVVTSGGDYSTIANWVRLDATVTGIDVVPAASLAEGTSGTSTPAHSTGPLAGTDYVIAFAALNSTGTGDQNTPVWSAGFDALTGAIQGSGGFGCAAFVGGKLHTGTDAETPSVSWSGAGCFNRYMLSIALTTTTSPGSSGVLAASLPSLGSAGTGAVTVLATLAATLPKFTAAAAGTVTGAGPINGQSTATVTARRTSSSSVTD
jgi:hypothetical protein